MIMITFVLFVVFSLENILPFVKEKEMVKEEEEGMVVLFSYERVF